MKIFFCNYTSLISRYIELHKAKKQSKMNEKDIEKVFSSV